MEKGTLERSVLSDRIEVAYVPLPAEGKRERASLPESKIKNIVYNKKSSTTRYSEAVST